MMPQKSSATRLAPAHQRSVDVGLGQQLGRVGRLHRAAVQHPGALSRRRD